MKSNFFAGVLKNQNQQVMHVNQPILLTFPVWEVQLRWSKHLSFIQQKGSSKTHWSTLTGSDLWLKNLGCVVLCHRLILR